MAYSDFTLDRLIRDFGVKVRGERSLFSDVTAVEPSSWLLESLTRANNIGFGSEKSRSERLVSPVLMELSDLNHDSFAIISGANLDIDASRGLNGECDFILSFTRLQDLIQAPIFCITEAKKQDVEMGTAQCAAQLIGAAQLNRQSGQPISTLYGCSTTGLEWRFLRFEPENMMLVVDETRYLVNETAKLLGVLQQIVNWQIFAQKSEPLEGIYYTNGKPRPEGYSFDALRFYRDGTFLETSIGGDDKLLDIARLASWFGINQPQKSGHYKLTVGNLTLRFDRSDKHCEGTVLENGEVIISRFEGQPPLSYRKYFT